MTSNSIISNLQGQVLSASATILRIEPCKKRLADCGMTKVQLVKLVTTCLSRVHSDDMEIFIERLQLSVFWRDFGAHETWEDFLSTLDGIFENTILDSMELWREKSILVGKPKYLVIRLLKGSKKKWLSVAEATHIMDAINSVSSSSIAEDLYGVLEKACDQVQLITSQNQKSLHVQFDEKNHIEFPLQLN